MSLRVALARNPIVSAGAAVAVAATTALVVLGWAAPSHALGGGTAASGTSCTPSQEDGRLGISVVQARNTTSGVATITGVELLDAEGLEVVGFALRAEDEPDASFVGLPLEEMGSTPSVAPVDLAPGASAFVAVELETTTTGGAHVGGIRVQYTVDGRFGAGSVDFGMDVTTPPDGETCL